jgi:hypothetical protein
MTYLSNYLEAIAALLRQFVVFRNVHQVAAAALYVAHTYAIEAADVTPYLIVTSAQKQSGKTRLLEVLELLVCKPAFVSHISEAALYRTIAAERPTLLFDEFDAVFGKRAAAERNEGLRAVVNAGHRRGAAVRRCVGEGRKLRVEKFDVFCAKVLAGIGTVPDTISDRGIHIRLQRRGPGETVSRFRARYVEPDAADLRSALSEWGEASLEYLGDARPSLPDQLDDRQQDAWEPLLAIADLAAGDWPERARVAAVELAEADASDEPLGILLLGHLRETFNGHDRLATEDVLRALIERDDAPWAEWWAKDVSDDRIRGPAARLARLLKPFEVAPKVYRDGALTVRGYARDALEGPWSRYLSPHPPEKTKHVTEQVATTSDVTSYDFFRGTGEDESEQLLWGEP